jgi:phosphoribosyl 1,2-cyclic phosphodiesterase
MGLYICSLNSGSNANCYYIGNDTEAILVDAGLSCRETEKRIKKAGLFIEKVKALFVSHEHADHITGLPAISRKYRIPVYITAATLANSRLPIEPALVQPFSARHSVKIGSLLVTPFTKRHDAADPHSFLVSGNGVRVGVLTDIGQACKEVVSYFKQCNAAFLESNYCEEMLEKGSYPIYLKNRIRGNQGHLSNTQALDLFTKHRPPQLSRLILSHLSKNNNDPDLVNKLFTKQAGNVAITVASRYEASAVFYISGSPTTVTGHLPRNKRIKAPTAQLSLF